jgi:hypothetical protein
MADPAPPGSAGRSARTRTGARRDLFDSGSAASQKSGRKLKWLANATYSGCGTTTLATTLAFKQLMRSVSTTAGTPPSSSKHLASSANVVARVWSGPKRTKRTRLRASTAQNTLRPASSAQSTTRYWPGTGTQDRYVRRCFRQFTFASAAARRKLRAEPRQPAFLATGNRRSAEIRPSLARTRCSISATTLAALRTRAGAGRRPTWPAARRSRTRFTVLTVVPHKAAAPRYCRPAH